MNSKSSHLYSFSSLLEHTERSLPIRWIDRYWGVRAVKRQANMGSNQGSFRDVTSDLWLKLSTNFPWSRHHAAAFSLQVPNACTDLDPTLLYISMLKTHAKFVRENTMLALGVCFACSNPARVLAAGLPLQITFELLRTNSFVSTQSNLMKCFVN